MWPDARSARPAPKDAHYTLAYHRRLRAFRSSRFVHRRHTGRSNVPTPPRHSGRPATTTVGLSQARSPIPSTLHDQNRSRESFGTPTRAGSMATRGAPSTGGRRFCSRRAWTSRYPRRATSRTSSVGSSRAAAARFDVSGVELWNDRRAPDRAIRRRSEQQVRRHRPGFAPASCSAGPSAPGTSPARRQRSAFASPYAEFAAGPAPPSSLGTPASGHSVPVGDVQARLKPC